MKRRELVSDLIAEGFKSETLNNFSDQQIVQLYERIFTEASEQKEAVTKNVQQTTMSSSEWDSMMNKGGSVSGTVKRNPDRSVTVTKGNMEEDLVGDQDKLDKNKNGRLDKEDFKLLRKEKKGEHKEEKSEDMTESKKWIQKALHPSKKGSLRKALGVKKGETIPSEKLKAAVKKHGKLGQRARFAMNVKNLKENNSEMNQWVEGLVNEKYHPFTSKGEIMSLINEKIDVDKKVSKLPSWLSYDAIMGSSKSNASPEVAPAPVKPKTVPDTRPKPKTPYQPGPGKNPKPKALSENPETAPAPVKPKTVPDTKPKPKTPYQPGPGKNPKPKAKY